MVFSSTTFLLAFLPLVGILYFICPRKLRNALLLALGNFPKTLCMIALVIGAAIVTFFNGYTLWYGILVWLLLGFAVVAWINSQLLYGIFKKLMPPEEDGGEEAKSEAGTPGKDD